MNNLLTPIAILISGILISFSIYLTTPKYEYLFSDNATVTRVNKSSGESCLITLQKATKRNMNQMKSLGFVCDDVSNNEFRK
tara:strand:- start:890 stop:1135 length:246 start_codon:yes stop_codon:yes gene_type:complete